MAVSTFRHCTSQSSETSTVSQVRCSHHNELVRVDLRRTSVLRKGNQGCTSEAWPFNVGGFQRWPQCTSVRIGGQSCTHWCASWHHDMNSPFMWSNEETTLFIVKHTFLYFGSSNRRLSTHQEITLNKSKSSVYQSSTSLTWSFNPESYTNNLSIVKLFSDVLGIQYWQKDGWNKDRLSFTTLKTTLWQLTLSAIRPLRYRAGDVRQKGRITFLAITGNW